VAAGSADGSTAAASVVPEFRFLENAAAVAPVGGHMPAHRKSAGDLVRHAEHPFCTIKDFVQLCDEINVKWSARSRSIFTAAAAVNLPWWFWNMSASSVFLLSRAEKTR